MIVCYQTRPKSFSKATTPSINVNKGYNVFKKSGNVKFDQIYRENYNNYGTIYHMNIYFLMYLRILTLHVCQ